MNLLIERDWCTGDHVLRHRIVQTLVRNPSFGIGLKNLLGPPLLGPDHKKSFFSLCGHLAGGFLVRRKKKKRIFF